MNFYNLFTYRFFSPLFVSFLTKNPLNSRIESKDLRSYLNLANLFASKLEDKKSAEQLYRQALYQIDLDQSKSHQRQQTITPLHLTVLIRLANLLNEDPLRTEELLELNRKILNFQTKIMQKTAKELPSCVGQCNYNIDPKFLDQLYNVRVWQIWFRYELIENFFLLAWSFELPTRPFK